MKLIHGCEENKARCQAIMMIGFPKQDATGLAGCNAPFSLFYFLLALVDFAFLLGSLSIGAKNLPVCE